jgi:hypothetical protein
MEMNAEGGIKPGFGLVGVLIRGTRRAKINPSENGNEILEILRWGPLGRVGGLSFAAATAADAIAS